jgi:uncharacterized membrane protein YkvA (DUF1232 family)
MGRLFGRVRLLRVFTRNGRLAWRLFRDGRTPSKAKLILLATVLAVISPINWLPNFIPIVGQLEDVALLSLGFELFFRAVPDWLKAEHEAALQGRTVAAHARHAH